MAHRIAHGGCKDATLRTDWSRKIRPKGGRAGLLNESEPVVYRDCIKLLDGVISPLAGSNFFYILTFHQAPNGNAGAAAQQEGLVDYGHKFPVPDPSEKKISFANPQ